MGSLRQERGAEQTELGTAWSWNVRFEEWLITSSHMTSAVLVVYVHCSVCSMRVVLRSVFLGPIYSYLKNIIIHV